MFALKLQDLTSECSFQRFFDGAFHDRFMAVLRNLAIKGAHLKKKESLFETACEMAGHA